MPRTKKRSSGRQVESPLFSVPEGAKYLRTDVNEVRKAIKYGELPVFDFGSPKLYKPTLDAFIVKWQNRGDELEAKLKAAEQAAERADLSPKEDDSEPEERRIFVGD